MRTTRDAIKKDWLHCPEANEKIDVRLAFSDCKKDHGCSDRPPSHCPLYVERLIKRAVKWLRDRRSPAGQEQPGVRLPTE
jgi:hypothetical protein